MQTVVDRHLIEYERQLLRRVSKASAQGFDFEELCRQCLGAFPTEVRTACLALSDRTFERSALSYEPSLSILDRIKLPSHAIDYDWRFDAGTAQLLGSLLRKYPEVLCAGTPSVYDYLARAGHPAHLVDSNPLLASNLVETQTAKFTISDIAQFPDMGRRYHAAIMDPPWYPEDYALWISKLIPLLHARGSLYIILFRALTRPGADQERKSLLRQLSLLGEVKLLDIGISYSSPEFELAVLGRLNMHGLKSWRVADLVHVNLRQSALNRINASEPLKFDKKSWRRFVIGDQLVVVAVDKKKADNIRFTPSNENYQTFELLSVSRRDPNRAKIDVWTSQSRAATATGTELISHIFDGLVSKGIKFLCGLDEVNRTEFLALCESLKIDLGRL